MKNLFIFFFLIVSVFTYAQESVELSGYSWQLSGNAKVDSYKEQPCLNTGNGDATIQNIVFTQGIIEYDICIDRARGFAGVRFHGDSQGNTEEFYIRKHQSGNPDAMQYTPVYNGNAGWQLYYGDGYSAAKPYVFDEWFKIRLIISGTRGEVYIENMDIPVLIIHELKLGEKEGPVTFYGPARFTNIKITQSDSPVLKGKFKEIVKAGPEVIQEYQVSEIFDAENLMNENLLPANFAKKLQFNSFKTEADGLLNISRTGALSEKKNAVLLKILIDSETDLIKGLTFGFSDLAKIFVNGKSIWMGSDIYSSRDYRFLGTIGYFDSVYLDLKTGKNEIYVMVAESFGGWGFKARFEDLRGISMIK